MSEAVVVQVSINLVCPCCFAFLVFVFAVNIFFGRANSATTIYCIGSKHWADRGTLELDKYVEAHQFCHHVDLTLPNSQLISNLIGGYFAN